MIEKDKSRFNTPHHGDSSTKRENGMVHYLTLQDIIDKKKGDNPITGMVVKLGDSHDTYFVIKGTTKITENEKTTYKIKLAKLKIDSTTTYIETAETSEIDFTEGTLHPIMSIIYTKIKRTSI